MRLKIISDGTTVNTRVVNADTGEEIELVSSIEFKIRAEDSVPSAVIEILKPLVEVVTEAEVKVCQIPPTGDKEHVHFPPQGGCKTCDS